MDTPTIPHGKPLRLGCMTRKVVTVARPYIQQNAGLPPEQHRPVLAVATPDAPHLCNTVRILGPSRLTYCPDNPTECGATAFLTTVAAIETEHGRID